MHFVPSQSNCFRFARLWRRELVCPLSRTPIVHRRLSDSIILTPICQVDGNGAGIHTHSGKFLQRTLTLSSLTNFAFLFILQGHWRRLGTYYG